MRVGGRVFHVASFTCLACKNDDWKAGTQTRAPTRRVVSRFSQDNQISYVEAQGL